MAGTAFVMVFSSCNLLTGLTSDRVAGKSRYFGRHTLFAIGTLLFSTCLCLMGLSNAYWQLVVLRMGIAAGEAVCRYSKKSKQTAQYIINVNKHLTMMHSGG